MRAQQARRNRRRNWITGISAVAVADLRRLRLPALCDAVC
jgi:hypothetical protein